MIILFGVVGSGKSEQANRLEKKLNCPHITVSQVLKEQHNPAWDSLISAGKLVPDENVISLLEPVLNKVKKGEFILDGAPRSERQAEWLSQKIKSGGIKLTAIFHLVVSKETTLKRLLNRGREDDREEVIVERFRQYAAVTNPVLAYLVKQGYAVYDIDGEWPLDIVEMQIWNVLKDKIDAPQK
ncbi:MAG TPA: nucleoside monophosphate kinase [Candidatus Saccharimonadales bacterium]|nr:nucleoside monophosphate kinase [Candidatus Saccharimonadales bacterium]